MWLSPSVLLRISLCLLASPGVRSPSVGSDTGDDIDKADEAVGASRMTGGEPNNSIFTLSGPPEFTEILGFPISSRIIHLDEEGRLRGLGMRLHENLMLIHQSSALEIMKKQYDSYKNREIGSNNSRTLDVKRSEGDLRFIKVVDELVNIAGSPFGVYHQLKGSRYQGGHFELPVFERNPSEFGTDCHLFGYSNSIDQRFRTEKNQKMDPTTVEFVKIPMQAFSRKGCIWSQCPGAPHSSNVELCDIYDRGAPVLCGPEEKLTYLYNGPSKHCRLDYLYTFSHVPTMLKVIDNVAPNQTKVD